MTAEEVQALLKHRDAGTVIVDARDQVSIPDAPGGQRGVGIFRVRSMYPANCFLHLEAGSCHSRKFAGGWYWNGILREDGGVLQRRGCRHGGAFQSGAAGFPRHRELRTGLGTSGVSSWICRLKGDLLRARSTAAIVALSWTGSRRSFPLGAFAIGQRRYFLLHPASPSFGVPVI